MSEELLKELSRLLYFEITPKREEVIGRPDITRYVDSILRYLDIGGPSSLSDLYEAEGDPILLRIFLSDLSMLEEWGWVRRVEVEDE